MTTTTRNEAAERLRDRTLEDGPPFGSMFWNGWETAHDKIDQSLDEALAVERRATVERIRERLTLQVVKDASGKWGEVYDAAATDAILDEEAAAR